MPAPTAADRGREVRQRLLKAATELIAERGWTAVSTRMLAERASVAPGLVHYHFTSVQALLGEAAIGVIAGLVEELGPVLDHARTPEDVLELMLSALEDYSGHDPVSLLVVETYLAATRDDDLGRRLGGVVADFRERLSRSLREHGVASPEETAAVLAAAVDGVLLHHALTPGLTATTVVPVLRRVLTRSEVGRHDDRKAGGHT
ncbi:MAG: TetR family transcriptional regulator [Micromonosporaceae bacterium]|nr:TetR family transcriptional regulator [Micromonosporaceae bacterium]